MSSDKKQILICGNYGAGNLGDEALLDGILRLVATAWPNSHAIVLSAKPKSTNREHKIDSVNLFPAGFKSQIKFWFGGQFLRTIATLWNADLVIMGGGGLFIDEKWQAVWIWFVQSWWFWLFRKKFICLAQSVGPLNSRFGRYLTKLVFSRALFISVRDSKSLHLLKNMEFAQVKLLSDAAFALTYEHEMAKNTQDQVILSLRDWPVGKHEKCLLELAKTIDWLWHDHKTKTIFIPFQEHTDTDKSQYSALKLLVQSSQALELKEVEDYKQALEIIGRSKLVIGMRLHSLIFATLESRPFVALSYSSKVRDLMFDLEMGNYVLDYNQVRFEQLKVLIEKIINTEQELSKHLSKQKMRHTYLFFDHEKALKLLL